MTGTPPVVLSIGGTDSGGAAGLAADLTTVAALGAHGACVVTAVTAQDTTGVRSVHRVPLDEVEAQLAAVLEDLPVAATKTGMLGSPEVVELVAERLGGGRHGPLVVDPVLVATSGAVLGDTAVASAYARVLLPVAGIVTPNHREAQVLLGRDLGPRDAAAALADLGCTVLLTGGDAEAPSRGGRSRTDWLAEPGREPRPLTHEAVDTANDHGTGCTHSAALAALLARGVDPAAAAAAAASLVTDRLRLGAGWQLGRGRGPVPHTFLPADPAGIHHPTTPPEEHR